MKKKIVCFIAVAMYLNSFSEMIFETDFEKSFQSAVNKPVLMDGKARSGVSVSALDKGKGVSNFKIEISDTSSRYAGITATDLPSDLKSAISKDAYMEFTITSDNPLALQKIKFSMMKHGFVQYAGITLRSSLDGYSTDLLTIANKAKPGVYPGTADLSAVKGFDAVKSVTFRFYLASEYKEGKGNRKLGIDNIQIQ